MFKKKNGEYRFSAERNAYLEMMLAEHPRLY